MPRTRSLHRYDLYELSTQDAAAQIEIMEKAYRECIGKRPPLHLREDFSGTFLISSEWVRGGPERTALAIDIDPKPLAWGERHHRAPLAPHERRRVRKLRQDVRKVTDTPTDVIGTFNFSFYALQTRAELLEYFKAARRSLRPRGGVLVLEMIGGPGFIENPFRERRTVKAPSGERFKYIWHQRLFDPIRRYGEYTISFKLESGRELRDAFIYRWRVWTIPEVRECLRDAGFDDAVVYWETEDNNGDPVYTRRERVPDDYTTWACYVVGVRSR